MATINVKAAAEEARHAKAAAEAAQGPQDKDPSWKERKPSRNGSKPARTRKDTAKPTSPSDDLNVPLEDELAPAESDQLTKRVHVPLSEHLYRLLKTQRAQDDIDTTVRMRAMVELWEKDSRWRARVDRLARIRNSELIRHRRPNP